MCLVMLMPNLLDPARMSFPGPIGIHSRATTKFVSGVAINIYMTGRRWPGERKLSHLFAGSNLK